MRFFGFALAASSAGVLRVEMLQGRRLDVEALA